MFELWEAIGALTALALVFGLLLGYASRRFAVEGNPVVDQIDEILPQSQCAQCGYPGCKPYAEAVANGDSINKCVPGGEAVMLKLATLLNVEPQQWAKTPLRQYQYAKSPTSTRATVSAAPNAFRLVRLMPLSVPPAPCIP